MTNKLISFLGLAQKAGKLVSGETACETAFKKREARLAVVCSDASDNTKKKFSQKSWYYKCPFEVFLTKSELGKAIGRENRAAFVITDEGFAKNIRDMIDKIKNIES